MSPASGPHLVCRCSRRTSSSASSPSTARRCNRSPTSRFAGHDLRRRSGHRHREPRLLNELRQRTDDLTERTTDLTEALEQQTATSEVLQVISNSPGDLQPVFEAMLANAVRICDAAFGNIYRWDGNTFSLVATHNTPLAYAEARRRSPVRPNPNNIFGLMVATKAVAHVPDAAKQRERGNWEYATAVELGGVRTCLAAPMLKEHELIGSISLFRQEVRPFTDKQITLITNFAAQAVIAIGTRGCSMNSGNRWSSRRLPPMCCRLSQGLPATLARFATMLENAVRICDAKFGIMNFPEPGGVRPVAMHNVPEAFAELRQRVVHFGPKHPLTRAAATKQVVHIPDLELYADEDPVIAKFRELTGARTILHVPMLKDEELVGIVSIYRQEVRPFTDKQVDLVKNFAAQAVIAIENARLLDELRQRTADLTERTTDLTEALEQQTATSEVLQVISSSPGDLEPVFAAMLVNAVRISGAKFGIIHSWDGEYLRLLATYNLPPALEQARKGAPELNQGQRPAFVAWRRPKAQFISRI